MSEIVAQDIATMLGLSARPGKPVSILSLIRSIEGGLPVAALYSIAAKIAPDDKGFPLRLVPKATLDRRKQAHRLSADEGGRLARLAQVWAAAVDVWQDEAAARAFLHRPHALLEGDRPIDLALGSEFGAKLVEDILGRLKYGSAA
jgi:putative toxin-antitoxin system antitoxin component (TIGR02293 family)